MHVFERDTPESVVIDAIAFARSRLALAKVHEGRAEAHESLSTNDRKKVEMIVRKLEALRKIVGSAEAVSMEFPDHIRKIGIMILNNRFDEALEHIRHVAELEFGRKNEFKDRVHKNREAIRKLA